MIFSTSLLEEAGRLAQGAIDALSAQLCVLDEGGTILATNKAWRRFAEANPPVAQRSDTGDNYLVVCDGAQGAERAEAAAFAMGIRAVVSGELTEFALEYPCHSPTEMRWFVGRVTRFAGEGPIRLVVAHENITARKLAEEASQRLAAIVASSDDAIIGKDLRSIITSWNQGAESIFGYTSDEMVGTSIRRIIPADRQQEEDFIIGKIAHGESVEHFETLRLTKDRRLIDISLTASPIKDTTGQVAGVSKVARDISARKRVEEELRLFRSLVDQSNDTFEVVDPETGRFLDVNEKGAVDLRCTREEYLEQRVTDINPEMTDALWADFVKKIRSTGVITGRGTHRRKDGSTFPIEFSAKWVRLDRDYIVTAVRDITDRLRSEERFRRLVDSNAQGVMIRRTNGEITEANDAFLQMVGYTREELEAGTLNWIALTPPEFAKLDQNCTEEMKTKGACVPYEKEYLRKDGTRVPVLEGAAAFTDNPDEGISFALDLTERKKLEQQFLRAQRMEGIGTLAGGIAHDLNNSLGPIIMSLDLLKMKFTDPASQELLSIIEMSAQRGADMVRQVLSFARGVEGQRMEVQVKHLLGDMTKIARDTFPKDIEVRTMYPQDLWSVIGDPTQLHQVLLNLCVNARDAMPAGGVLTLSAQNITLDAHYVAMNAEASPGPHVYLQVEDTGCGMPPEVTAKIFDPFFTTKEIGKGTGLGLSTSMGIVRSHGGFIRVYSELGKGTTFKVYLPAVTESSPAAVAQATEMPRGNGEVILVVDDEASIRDITQQTLEAFGYRVLVASDGAEAVAVYARRGAEIAAVLTDMMMPIMDGPATIRALRRMNPAVLIVGASGLSANGHVTQAANLGVKHFLPKPYTAGTLLKALKEVLSPVPQDSSGFHQTT